MKRRVLRIFLLTLATLARLAADEPPLLLISLDGFRWDYCERFPAESAALRALKREGVSARALIPVFPSNTFPNHYSIVTGLYPARHGIVNNDFFDPEAGLVFRYNQPNAVHDPRWWGGEPIWVTAIKNGRAAAAAFWVGSEAPIGGVRPTFWRNYDYSIPFERRLDELVGWMKLPSAERPAVVAFYLEETNSAGHRFGPATPEVAAAIKLSDDHIATMLARLRAEGIEPNLIIVSDHGMSSTGIDRALILDDSLDLTRVQIYSDGSSAALRPLDGDALALLRALRNLPHARAMLAKDLPAQFRLHGNARIAPVWVIPDEGWQIISRATFNRLRTRFAAQGFLQGDHGYDPALPAMHGVLIAHGPAFVRGLEIPPVENVHVYNLMCAVLKLTPAPNDGDDRLVRAMLR